MSDYSFLGFEIPEGILGERRRQIDVEGWSAGHDDAYDDGELLQVAMLFFRHGARLPLPMLRVPVGYRGRHKILEKEFPIGWPWGPTWWKPKTPQRDLERAGALCLAEIDRMRRADPTCDVDVVAIVLKDVIKALAALKADGVS